MLSEFKKKLTLEWCKAKSNAQAKKDNFSFWGGEIFETLRNHWKKILLAIPLIFLLLWASTVWILKTDEIVKVLNKETKATGVELITQIDKKTGKEVQVPRNIDTYFIYTDKGAFQFRESWFFLQFEVADRFGKIEENKYYKFTHYGFRNSFFDWYENIVDFEEYTPQVEVVEKAETPTVE